MTKEKKQEFTLRITQANRTGLVVILYEITLSFLEEALADFDKGEKQKYKNSIGKAKDCLDELVASLNMEYEIALSLHSLYYFYQRELSRAAIREDRKAVVGVMEMLSQLKAAYEEAAVSDTSASLMQNAQTVYSGLTYGKGSLNVDLADQGTDRGFRI